MKSSIDLGLAVSALNSRYGVPKTNEEIAAYCNCSRERIRQIAERGLRKIRYKLYCDKTLAEALSLFEK